MTRTDNKFQGKTEPVKPKSLKSPQSAHELLGKSASRQSQVGFAPDVVGRDGDAGKGDQQGLLSLNSVDVSSINSSFNEIVALNEEGHPFIDINRLVYKPRQKHKQQRHYEESLHLYLPDFLFIVFNFLSLGCSTYFVLIGATTLTWKASTGMFQVPQCASGESLQPDNFYYVPCYHFYEDPEKHFHRATAGYNFTLDNAFPIIRTNLYEPHYFGLTLICVQVVNVINVLIGVNACLQGYKPILVQHVAVDGVLVLIEFIISAIMTFTSRCETKDIEVIRVLLHHFIRHYGILQKKAEDELEKEKALNGQVDALQIRLGCCGVDSWADYLPTNYPTSDFSQFRSQMDETEMVIPFSCCRSWWIRNIYCSHGAHLWAHPSASPEKALQFHERINQEGCIYKLDQMCNRIKRLMGQTGFYTTLIHLGIVAVEAAAAFTLISRINTLVREKKKLMKKKEITGEPGESGSDLGVDVTTVSEPSQRLSMHSTHSKAIHSNPWAKVPPPTEDEIQTIRQRSNFNEFMSKVRSGKVGKWMKEAQEQVTEGHDDQKDEPQTAEERKAREKELLHRKLAREGGSVDSTSDLARMHHKKHRRDRHHLDDEDEHLELGKTKKARSQGSEIHKKNKRRKESRKSLLEKKHSAKSPFGEDHTKKKGHKIDAEPEPEPEEEVAPPLIEHLIGETLPPAEEQPEIQPEPDTKPAQVEAVESNVSLKAQDGKKKKRKRKTVPVPVSKKSTKILWKRTSKKAVSKSTVVTESENEDMDEPRPSASHTKKKKKKKPKRTRTKAAPLYDASPGSRPGDLDVEADIVTDLGTTDGEADTEAEGLDDDERRRRRKKKRTKGRRKQVQMAKKKRDPHQGKKPWFAYF